MGCLVVLLALMTPRLVMVVLWVFTDYLSRAFEGFLWPLIGFFLLPTTTMAYAVAENEFDGVRGWGLAIVILGVLIDFGLIGSGRSIGRRRR